MTKFEYMLTVLGEQFTPAGQLKKVEYDIVAEQERPFWKRSKQRIALLKEVKQDLIAKYKPEELAWSEAADKENTIKSIAKRSAVQLVSQGKVDPHTMLAMASLDKEDFSECVKFSTKFASFINHETKEAEKSVTSQDIVPDELMK